jgi:hypothetical protein
MKANTSVDAKNAKGEREERKGDFFLLSWRPLRHSFASFASTLAFNRPFDKLRANGLEVGP